MSHGRGTTDKRGLGKGGKTSSGTPAKMADGFKKTGGDGMGGNTRSVDVPKDRQPKNMGSAGGRHTGPKYGRAKGSKTY